MKRKLSPMFNAGFIAVVCFYFITSLTGCGGADDNSGGTPDLFGPAPNSPVITVEAQGATSNTEVAFRDAFDVGNVNVGNYNLQTFEIWNDGTGDLDISGTPLISISQGTEENFTLDLTETDAFVTSGGYTEFDVKFMPLTTGSKSASISITSDSTTNPVYTFTVTGTATAK